MSGPPPPPPPPPMPGFGGPPPPPPPPPGGIVPARPGKKDVPNVGALLGDISKGARLKPAVTNDRSAPVVEKKAGNSGPAVSGAPPIPGVPKPPSGLAPAPGRARASSDTGGGGNGNNSGLATAPQLGGLFAGGMPKLKKTGKNLDAEPRETMSSYSDSESPKRMTNLRPPTSSAPKPPPAPAMSAPSIPKANGLRPSPHVAESSPVNTFPSIAALKRPPPKPAPRPSSSISVSGKPPPVPPTSRKLSSTLSQVSSHPAPPPLPPFSSTSPAPPSAPPLPPPSSTSPAPPSAPPPPPTSTAPRAETPPPRSNPPPPPLPHLPPSLPPQTPPTNGLSGSPLALQAAARAFAGNQAPSPLAQPPSLSAPLPPPPTTNRQSPSQPVLRPNSDASSYTLSNGSFLSTDSNRYSTGSGVPWIEDKRWKFQDDGQLPPPRQFTGGPKRYRAGRGSSVPLDLNGLG